MMSADKSSVVVKESSFSPASGQGTSQGHGCGNTDSMFWGLPAYAVVRRLRPMASEPGSELY